MVRISYVLICLQLARSIRLTRLSDVPLHIYVPSILRLFFDWSRILLFMFGPDRSGACFHSYWCSLEDAGVVFIDQNEE
jgi:hypothetical protein